jgi:hypothetical protein
VKSIIGGRYGFTFLVLCLHLDECSDVTIPVFSLSAYGQLLSMEVV